MTRHPWRLKRGISRDQPCHLGTGQQELQILNWLTSRQTHEILGRKGQIFAVFPTGVCPFLFIPSPER